MPSSVKMKIILVQCSAPWHLRHLCEYLNLDRIIPRVRVRHRLHLGFIYRSHQISWIYLIPQLQLISVK